MISWAGWREMRIRSKHVWSRGWIWLRVCNVVLETREEGKQDWARLTTLGAVVLRLPGEA